MEEMKKEKREQQEKQNSERSGNTHSDRKSSGKNSLNEQDREDKGDAKNKKRKMEPKKRNFLRCLHWNCGGLRTQLNDETGIRLVLNAVQPDIIFLNEIRMLNGINDFATGLGYTAIVVPSQEGQGNNRKPYPKRGSAILIRKTLENSIKRVETGEKMDSEGDWEIVWVDLHYLLPNGNEEKRRFITAYLKPGANITTRKRFLKALSDLSENQPTVVTGDLNIHRDSCRVVENGTGLQDCLDSGLATHLQKNGLRSAIDYILSSDRRDVVCHIPIHADNGTNHTPIVFDVATNLNPNATMCQEKDCDNCIHEDEDKKKIKKRDPRG